MHKEKTKINFSQGLAIFHSPVFMERMQLPSASREGVACWQTVAGQLRNDNDNNQDNS